jgi:bifunctional DNase/RNase
MTDVTGATGDGASAEGAVPAVPADEALPADGAGPTDGPVPAVEPPPEAAVEWRVMVVAGVRLELPAAHPDVLLQESQAPWRELRIPVGLAEGTAIAYAFKGVATPRPLTHAFVSELLDRHGVELIALRIVGRQGAVFLAELDTTGPRGRQVLSCRPSDGIAMVLRRAVPTPILVAEAVLAEANAG